MDKTFGNVNFNPKERSYNYENKAVHIPSITCEPCLTIISRELWEMEGVKSVCSNDEENIFTLGGER